MEELKDQKEDLVAVPRDPEADKKEPPKRDPLEKEKPSPFLESED